MFDETGITESTTESAPRFPERVRLAQPADEGAIMEMLHEGHAENGMFRFVDERALELVRKATRRECAFIGLIDAPDGSIAASVCLTLDRLWYTDEYHVCELWAFVRKPYRASSYAHDLVDWAKAIADGMKMPLTMGIFSTKRTEAKVRLYRKWLKPIGAFFGYNLKYAHGPLASEEDRHGQ